MTCAAVRATVPSLSDPAHAPIALGWAEEELLLVMVNCLRFRLDSSPFLGMASRCGIAMPADGDTPSAR